MAAKKTAAKKTTASADKPMTKSEIYAHLSAQTNLTKREIGDVFDALNGLIKKNVGRRGPGIFTLPGLMKIKVVKKPATKARKGTNPFTGEPTVFKAKPARKAVKVQPLKGLKDML
ncbi:MAG TPA: HU family DNA-binding protein [Gammaproteobacteria bacterium]|nr:HU family DNA-binding protein [Gammaproteobacteria bacterium]HET7587524.1 HU family DNA-binding protein [Gammaproteobacteria bacterium]